MYDKLGDLLNETLDKGFVQFVEVEGEDKKTTYDDSFESKKVKDDESSCNSDSSIKDEEFSININLKKSQSSKKIIYKKITPEIERAFHLLDISFSANLDDARKAYKDKIKYFHPDKYEDNAVLKKVATDKTRQVVDAYNIVVKFISS